MLGRIIVISLFVLALGGCVLQSKTPFIAADAGEALLDSYGLKFVSYGLSKGNWKRDNETFIFVPEGRHYRITAGKDSLDIAFKKLEGNWWILQAEEAGKQPVYSLVDAQKAELFLYPMACKPLKDAGTYDAWIEFKGDDCIIKDGVDTAALFKAFAADPGPQTSKIVPKG